MFDQKFQSLIDQGMPTGKVAAVNEFIITVTGLAPIGSNALVLFENGSQGLVREVLGNQVVVLNLDTQAPTTGMAAVVENNQLVTGVGIELIGRVVSARGRPLDGGGTPPLNETWPVFNDAPGLIEREQLDGQLDTGVALLDMLFPVVLGQRIAVLGDSKTGKSSLLTQVAQNQANKERVVVYVLIAKRPSEIDEVLGQLKRSGALRHTIVVATSVFDSLVESYLAPYVGCAMAEFLWHNGNDTVILYDDLTNHAQIHREISLLSGANPGRDSFPGDIFYRHSSLLERAGKLNQNSKTLTAIPAVLTPSNDMTTYLPTNVISITDGQIIFDTDIMREGRRPAINVGLSVSRVGGRAQTDHRKELGAQIFQALNRYFDAQEFSHFASEMALEAQENIQLGERLLDALHQTTKELYSLPAQQLLLDVVLQTGKEQKLNMDQLKQWIREQDLDGDMPETDADAYQELVQQTISDNVIEVKK
jgi:F-type H+-transporting ATPase subunit alpha